jgi:hypothetical protein
LKSLLWVPLSVLITFCSASSHAALGDKYWCRSELYGEVKSDGTLIKYRPVSFYIWWVKPKNGNEEIIWVPSNHDLWISEFIYAIDGNDTYGLYKKQGKEAFSFTIKRFFRSDPNPTKFTRTSSGTFIDGKLMISANNVFDESIITIFADCENKGKVD